MRFLNLTAAERRTIAIGAAIIIVLVSAFRGVPAWMAWRNEARESAGLLVDEVAMTAAAYDAFPTILDSLEARISRLQEMRPAPLAAGSVQEAEAVLVRMVEAAARAGSIQVMSLTAGIDTAGVGSLPVVSVRLDGAGDITGVAMLLSQLEGGHTAVAVQNLSIVPQNIETPESEMETLMLHLEVKALALGSEPRRNVDQ